MQMASRFRRPSPDPWFSSPVELRRGDLSGLFKTVKWEEVYNAKRLHSSLDDMPPDEFELKYSMC
jgi:transposase InsO family protein